MNFQIQPPETDRWYGVRRMLLRWLISTLAIFVAVWLVPGITFTGPGWQLGIVAVILGLLNTLVRPLLLLFALPLIILTLGFFALVINATLLALTSAFADQLGIAFQVDNFWSALFGGMLISIVSSILHLLAGDHNVSIHIQRGEQE